MRDLSTVYMATPQSAASGGMLGVLTERKGFVDRMIEQGKIPGYRTNRVSLCRLPSWLGNANVL